MTSAFAQSIADLNGHVIDMLSDAAVLFLGQEITGVFMRDYVGNLEIAGSQPALTLASAYVPAAPEGSDIVVNGVAYKVVACKPDGTGLTLLLLEVAA